MSIEQHITSAANWFKGEAKFLTFDIGETLAADGSVADPVDLTTFAAGVEFQLARTRGGVPVLVKRSATPGEIVITDGQSTNDRARVVVAGAETASLRADYPYFFTLRELDSGSILTHGTAVIQNAGAAAP